MFQRSTWAHIAYLWVVSLLLLCHSMQAQNVNGTLTGTVADPSGAVIPGATVIMKNDASGDERRTVSNNDGFFSINAVPAWRLHRHISAQGFEKYQTDRRPFRRGRQAQPVQHRPESRRRRRTRSRFGVRRKS